MEDIQRICKNLRVLPKTSNGKVIFDFNVGGKMFLVTAPEEVPPTASIKVSDEAFEDLSAKRGFSPAPYMARHQWIKIDDINHWSEKQWEFYLPMFSLPANFL